MKDQYVGDVNDYLKYSLLRALIEDVGHRLFVCWMLTPSDGGPDGDLTAYLKQPSRFRAVDPRVFDALAAIVDQHERSVRMIEQLSVLPGASFDRTIVPIAPEARRRWMSSVLERARDYDLLFFDPDNGLEVASVSKGRRGSDKYLYWDELDAALASHGSVVVYQHFPRRPREEFVASLLDTVKRHSPDREPFAVYTSRVAYLVAPNRGDDLRVPAGEIAKRWTTHLTLVEP